MDNSHAYCTGTEYNPQGQHSKHFSQTLGSGKLGKKLHQDRRAELWHALYPRKQVWMLNEEKVCYFTSHTSCQKL